MNVRKRRILAGLTYVAAVALLFEGVARILLAQSAFIDRIGSPFDEPSWRYRWLARSGSEPPNLALASDAPHPTRGWTLRAGLRGLPGPYGSRVSSNALGARGAREIAGKRAHVTRVLALGDSFTFGQGVSDDEAYPALLESRVPGIEVVNLGVHGYGHDQMLITLREEGARLLPDVVLLGYVTDDALRNLVGFRDYQKPRFRLEEGALVLMGTPVQTPDESRARLRWRSRFFDLLVLARQQISWKSGARQREMEEVTLRLLDEILGTSRRMGATPVVVDLPILRELESKDPTPTAREALIETHVRSRGAPYLNLRPRFLAERRRGVASTVLPDGHWGPAEHRIAADGIAAWFVETGLVARPSAPASAGPFVEARGQSVEKPR
ncbi:MAG: GDSL-type esterase/lipase family protein [Thermoanaerobaculia bacterium]